MLTLVNFTDDFYSEAAVFQTVQKKIKRGECMKTVDCGLPVYWFCDILTFCCTYYYRFVIFLEIFNEFQKYLQSTKKKIYFNFGFFILRLILN